MRWVRVAFTSVCETLAITSTRTTTTPPLHTKLFVGSTVKVITTLEREANRGAKRTSKLMGYFTGYVFAVQLEQFFFFFAYSGRSKTIVVTHHLLVQLLQDQLKARHPIRHS